VVYFAPESHLCPVCGQPLKVLKTKRRNVATLAVGEFIAREIKCSCPRCGLIVGSLKLSSLLPPGGKFGYDVLVYVGESTFLRCRNAKEIVGELKERRISMCESEVGCLAGKFVVYLSFAHKRVRKNTQAFLNMHGGYVLHLDGTCEGGSPHLVSALDGITEIVLDNMKMPSENSDQLIPFLKRIKRCYGDAVAVVSDMGKGIAAAVKEVFKGIPLLVCHFHFLRDLGKDLFGAENEIIRKRLSKHGVGALLSRRARSLKKLIDNTPNLMNGFVGVVGGEGIAESSPVEYIPSIATHILIVWTLEGKHQGQGCGFPFDQRYLVFYQRVQRLDAILQELNDIQLTAARKDNRIYHKILHDLVGVRDDSALRKAASRMQEKVEVFDRLRAAMRITLPENKRGLNDNGELGNIKTIEKEVQKFINRLCKDKYFSKDPDYQKMIRQLREYWKKLFSDPIVVKTESGYRVIQPQRTNNILERFFRDMARRNRKRSGVNTMERTIKAMLADTPLVKNLENKDYLSILLDGRNSLQELFAEIDVQEVRDKINKLRNESETTSAETKRIIKMLEQPESLIPLLQQHKHTLFSRSLLVSPDVAVGTTPAANSPRCATSSVHP
jgi:transposase-like protein